MSALRCLLNVATWTIGAISVSVVVAGFIVHFWNV